MMRTLKLSSTAATSKHTRRCTRAPGTLTWAAAVGARPGYMNFKGSGGSVQFTSGTRKEPAESSAAGVLLGPAVGGHPGYLAFTRSGSGAAAASLSSGAVGFAGAAAALAAEAPKPQSDLESLQQKIQAFGIAGVAAYGVFNTLYYTGAFLFCWLFVAKVPQGLGVAVAARKFVEVLALVWAGSQVTKVPRALGALACAPLVDRALGWIKGSLKLESKQQAFWMLVAGCLVLATVLFGVVVLAWA